MGQGERSGMADGMPRHTRRACFCGLKSTATTRETATTLLAVFMSSHTLITIHHSLNSIFRLKPLYLARASGEDLNTVLKVSSVNVSQSCFGEG